MQINRRIDAEHSIGLDFQAEDARINNLLGQEKERAQAKADKKQELLQNSPTYRLMDTIQRIMDENYLDFFIGLIFPGIGDVISGALALPFLYFSLFRVGSITLTLAVLYNVIVDTAVGTIPLLGDIFDLLHKSNTKNFKLITGYINDDKEIVAEVNRNAVKSTIIIAIIGFLLWLVWPYLVMVCSFVWGIFSTVFSFLWWVVSGILSILWAIISFIFGLIF